MPSGPVYQLFHVFQTQTGVISVRPGYEAPPVFQSKDDLEAYLQVNPRKDGILRADWDNKDHGGPARFGLPEDLRLVGTGAYLWTRKPGEEPVQIVAVKTHGPSNGKLAQPSFLLQNSDMLAASIGGTSVPLLRWQEMQGSLNFAYAIPGEATLKTPIAMPEGGGEELFSYFASGREYRNRLANGIKYLRNHNSPHAGAPFEPVRADLKHNPLDEPYYQPIAYFEVDNTMIDSERALISDSGTNVNILASLMIDIPESAALILFDPEGYDREMRAITRGEMFAACAAGQGSVPMTAHCKDVLSRPQGPDVKYAAPAP